MGNYYAEGLNSAKLFRVYDTKLERVRRYLREEISFVRRELEGNEKILELGCGYGRIMRELAPYADFIVGIDISTNSVRFGEEFLKDLPNCEIRVMDAHDLSFGPVFDVVLCLQNGISAIKGEADHLVAQSLRVLVPGGKAYFSTYSASFWDHRLAWFREQADKGLIGQIDEEKTRNGNIVCKDGFTATTFSPEDLEILAQRTGCRYGMEEIDASSLFLILEKGTD